MPKLPVIHVIGLFFLLPQGNCDASCGRIRAHIFEVLSVDNQNNIQATPSGSVPVFGVGLTDKDVLTTINGLRTFGKLSKVKLVVVEKQASGDGPFESVASITTYQKRDDTSGFIPGMEDLALLRLTDSHPRFQYNPRSVGIMEARKVTCQKGTVYKHDSCSKITFLNRSVFYWDEDLLSYRRSSCGEIIKERRFHGNIGNNLYYYIGDNEDLKKLSGLPVFCKGYLVALMPYDVCKGANTGSRCCATTSVLESEYFWLSLNAGWNVPAFMLEDYYSYDVPDRPQPEEEIEKGKKGRRKKDEDDEDSYWTRPVGTTDSTTMSTVEPTSPTTLRVVYDHQEPSAHPGKCLLLFCFIGLFIIVL